MERTIITPTQFFSLMLLFLTGTTIIVGLNFTALQDSGFAVLFEMAAGTFMFYFYMYLSEKRGWQNLGGILTQAYGKTTAKVIILLYSLYFLYIAGRVTTDFSFFVTHIIFQDTPPWVIMIPFLMVIGYSTVLGIEAVARSAEILVFFTIMLLVMLWGLGFFSEEFDPIYLLPLFDQDWSVLLSMIFPTGISFPYGELIVFTALFSLVKHKKTVKRCAWVPISAAGCIIIITMELVIGILHAPMAEQYFFPFAKAMELVTYFSFIEHLEIFTTLLLLSGVFIKVFIFAYAAYNLFKETFPVKKTKLWHSFLLIFLIAGMSMIASENLIQHLQIGLKVVPYALHIPFQFGIPILTALVLMVKPQR
ncbi:endospore germination permease [Halobacillus litoralis]|uniref:Endospore germination permease n=1 Tax=Halobacillus litoralis TaxID=45668 RepID=A0A845DNU0_9BACI|nr:MULTISPECIES: endospore germination permease [Halobacillus]MYL18599.1 endospore germination permease [Halobacillus litoralis]MYL30392.1 endospore germination permease [Halobacillus halophilus]